MLRVNDWGETISMGGEIAFIFKLTRVLGDCGSFERMVNVDSSVPRSEALAVISIVFSSPVLIVRDSFSGENIELSLIHI